MTEAKNKVRFGFRILFYSCALEVDVPRPSVECNASALHLFLLPPPPFHLTCGKEEEAITLYPLFPCRQL